MLHTATIDAGTLSVLNTLMSMEEFASFSLVGGTALALKYGHRLSVDLDLFCEKPFDKQVIVSKLEQVFDNSFQYQGMNTKWGIFGYINNIKVDIVHYPHALIGNVETKGSIRLYNDMDLIAMKLQAILGRGKKKDFWDVCELLQYYELPDMIKYHQAKYPSQMLAISIPQALVYFVDAEESEDPISLKEQTWDDVKRGISAKVRSFLN